jgi:hypothetical protein
LIFVAPESVPDTPRRPEDGMSEVDRALCRKAAAECFELARVTTDLDKKQILLSHAQEWLKLAYSDHDTRFERLLSEFNAEQLTRRDPARRQQVQQQQKKLKEGRVERSGHDCRIGERLDADTVGSTFV